MKLALSKNRLYQLSKSTVGSLLRNDLLGRAIAVFFHDRIPSKGCRINTRNAAITPSTKASLLWGLYERYEIGFVKELMRSAYDVIDFGSSIGAVTAHIARKMDDSHQLVCVEANPVLLPSIRENTRSRSHRTSIVHGAVYYASDNSSPESIQLSLGDDSTQSKVGDGQVNQRSVEVPTTTLSKLIKEYQIGKYVLVSDIEGAEIGFIEHETSALSQCQQLIIEMHETRWDGQIISIEQMCEKLVKQHGFQLRAQRETVYVFDRA